jgi:hypothetical protein
MTDAPQTNRPLAVDEDSLTATQNLIHRLSLQMDDLKTKQKEVADMIRGVFDNDETLNEAETVAKEATKQAKERKSDLNETAEIKDLKLKLFDIREDLKMVQESLNTHLVNYFQMTGSTAVDLPDGTEREFKLEAKLKPASKV